MTTSKHPLRLALVSETWPPEVNGVAMTLQRLADGLHRTGHHVEIIRPRQDRDPAVPMAEECLIRGMPIPGYPALRFGLPAYRRLLRRWRQRRPDVVHVATEGPLGLSALFAAEKAGIPVLSTFHTNFHAYSRHYGLGLFNSLILSYLRWFHNRTVLTLVPTKRLAEELQQTGFTRLAILPRGVDRTLFSPQRRSERLRTSWGASPTDLVCLYVGRLAPEKNLALLFATHAALATEKRGCRLVCIGDGPLRQSLRKRHPDCLFPGELRGEELAASYASADLFLFPSMTETFGNVVVEALASGLPVVAFDCAAANTLIRPGRNGALAPPGDAQAFMAAARSLIVQLSDKMREHCRESVASLDWDSLSACYLDYLRQTIRKGATQRQAKETFFLAPD